MPIVFEEAKQTVDRNVKLHDVRIYIYIGLRSTAKQSGMRLMETQSSIYSVVYGHTYTISIDHNTGIKTENKTVANSSFIDNIIKLFTSG